MVFYYYAASENSQFSEPYSLQSNSSLKDYSTGDTLTIVTYNIGYLSGMTNNLPMERSRSLFENNGKNAASLLNRIDPDIICYQEIDFQSKRSFSVNQFEQLTTALKHTSTYSSINWNKNYVPFPYWPLSAHFGGIVSGQAASSKFTFAQGQTIVFDKPDFAPFYYKDFYLDRLLQIVDVKIGSDTLKVLNVHLEAFDKSTRVSQSIKLKIIADSIANLYPTLLVGDFNSKPGYVDTTDGMAYLMQSEKLESAISREQYDRDTLSSFTFNTEDPYQMIDYVLYGNDFVKVIEARVLREAGEISDHYPVLVKFVLVPQNPNN
ncbi:MAG: endonuclease/exonuclease/phosphatase family metal-dependent hydrolase [Marinoscillum sp.]|jgi:endonuclease/exonuclease/phosphatase family metal-dependent hydrolase